MNGGKLKKCEEKVNVPSSLSVALTLIGRMVSIDAETGG